MTFKKWLLTGAMSLALVACGNNDPETTTSSSDSDVVQAVANSPELGSFGIDLTAMDESVDPGDNFFEYVNGTWLNTFEIPADRSNYGSFSVLADRAEQQVQAIIEDSAAADAPEGSAMQKIGDLYNSFMDVEAIEAAGLDPIQDDLAAIRSADTLEDIGRLMTDPAISASAPIGGWVDVDSKQTDRYIFYITQAGLGLPDRDYYLDQDEDSKTLRGQYLDYIETMLTLAGDDNAAANAEEILMLETALAEVHWTREDRRDRDKTYTLMTKDELKAFAPGLPWDVMMEAGGLGDQNEFVVRETTAIADSAAIFSETPVATWKAYLTYHYMDNMAPYLNEEAVTAEFDFNGRILNGTEEQRERWKRGVSLINGNLGEAVGKVYVERHFPQESKEKMDDLIENLRGAFDDRIRDLPWMGEDTKVEALAKLEKFGTKIGHPEEWETYDGMDIVPGDLVGNIRRANVWQWNDMVSQLGQPIDRGEWFMTPQTVNAYYSPNRNEIVFPAAILQAPFFDPNADPAVNYGGIGAVIGHEFGHGFDDQGRKSDGDGQLREWWTAEDEAAFDERKQVLIDQYNAFEALPGEFVKGEFTLGENIGDLCGVVMAYHAYKLSLNGEEAPIIDGYTGDQRFFMAWAQVWRRLYREENLKMRLSNDPHSPSEFRTNGIVRNVDAWYDAFGVTEDDDLYLPPEERADIW